MPSLVPCFPLRCPDQLKTNALVHVTRKSGISHPTLFNHFLNAGGRVNFLNHNHTSTLVSTEQ